MSSESRVKSWITVKLHRPHMVNSSKYQTKSRNSGFPLIKELWIIIYNTTAELL